MKHVRHRELAKTVQLGTRWDSNPGSLTPEPELSKHYIRLPLTQVQFSHSVVSNSATPCTSAHQASLSITNSQSVLKLMSITSVMPSNHLILLIAIEYSGNKDEQIKTTSNNTD